jgi:hypothetical protein
MLWGPEEMKGGMKRLIRRAVRGGFMNSAPFNFNQSEDKRYEYPSRWAKVVSIEERLKQKKGPWDL